MFVLKFLREHMFSYIIYLYQTGHRLFRCFQNMLQKNPNQLFGQPTSWE